MDNLELLKKLKELGVTFSLPIPNQWGHETHLADPAEVLNFIKDPTAFYAKHFGVTKDQYIAWLNNRYSVTW